MKGKLHYDRKGGITIMSWDEHGIKGVDNEESETTPPLSNEVSKKILNCVKICEYTKCEHNAQQVHHITPREEKGKHTYQNMIGLCGYHHIEAGKNHIPRKFLRSLINERNDSVKKCVKNAIKGIGSKQDRNNGKSLYPKVAPGHGIQ